MPYCKCYMCRKTFKYMKRLENHDITLHKTRINDTSANKLLFQSKKEKCNKNKYFIKNILYVIGQ